MTRIRYKILQVKSVENEEILTLHRSLDDVDYNIIDILNFNVSEGLEGHSCKTEKTIYNENSVDISENVVDVQNGLNENSKASVTDVSQPIATGQVLSRKTRNIITKPS